MIVTQIATGMILADFKIGRRQPPGAFERAITKALAWRLVQVPLRERIGRGRPE